MHFHAEHGLFFETRRPLWTVVLSLASVATVLGLNVFLGSVAFPRAGAAGILLLLFAFTRGHSRIEPLVAWLIAVVACGLIGTAALKLDPDAFMSTSARISADDLDTLARRNLIGHLCERFSLRAYPRECRGVFGPCTHARCVYAVRMDSTTRYCAVASGRSGAIFECLGQSRWRGRAS